MQYVGQFLKREGTEEYLFGAEAGLPCVRKPNATPPFLTY
jgi:hypothetical protein